MGCSTARRARSLEVYGTRFRQYTFRVLDGNTLAVMYPQVVRVIGRSPSMRKRRRRSCDVVVTCQGNRLLRVLDSERSQLC